MTREEKQKAIDVLKISAPIMAITQEQFNDYILTLNKIMDWLEQETVSKESTTKNDLGVDCVSRQFMYELGATCIATRNKNGNLIALGAIEQLPPATPQEPKTGHWILADEQNKEDVENDNYRFICSECRCSDIHAKGTIVPYCWKCGARMIEPQESEE